MLWFVQSIRQALALDASVYAMVQVSPRGIWLAATVVFLAGLSEALGQSVVLFINQVRPRRFALALGFSGVTHLLGYMLWASVVWLVGTFALGQRQPPVAVASAVGLAYAPQLLSFFSLTPFLGNIFSVGLSLWSLLAIVVGVRVGLGVATWQAVLAAGLGWLAIQLWRRTLGRPLYALGRWLERRIVGTPLLISLRDLPYTRRDSDFLREWFERLGRDLDQRLDHPFRRDSLPGDDKLDEESHKDK